VFDNSHGQDIDIASGLTSISEDLPYYGFSVSSMDIFDPSILDACDVFVVTYCITDYNTTEIEIIQDFVNAGGALLIVTEWTTFGDGTDDLMNSFGYVRNSSSVNLEDSDDNVGAAYHISFDPDNINMHSTKVGVDVLEVYGSTALIEMPADAVPLVVTDTDGTATWSGTDEANGLPVAAAQTVGEGRIIVLCDNGFVSDHDWDSDATINYYDEDNEIFTRNAFRWLAGAGIPEQTVVFDYSNSPYGYLHGNWEPLANFLMFNGYNTIYTIDFEPTVYDSADILVICDGSIDYNTSEIAYLTSYVGNGGALLLWGDWQSYSQQIDPIGQEFGLNINTTGNIRDSDDSSSHHTGYVFYDGVNIGNHPIMDGVETIEVDLSNAFISIGSGTALVSTDGDGTTTWNDGSPAINLAVYAATTYNKGRVVFLTDVNLGTLADSDANGFPNLYTSDNPVFVANVFKWLAENRAPLVEVITPNGGEVINETISINWDAVDFDNDPMTFDVFYSDNNGSDWTILADDIDQLEFEWNTALHDDGVGYKLRVIASDGVLTGQDESDDTFELDNFYAPTVELTYPNGGEVLNGTITITWDAFDLNSDTLTYDVFYSDNNGSDWTALASGLTLPEFEWNTILHDDGIGYMIRVIVSDGVLTGQDESDTPFELDNFVGGDSVIDPMLLALIGAGVIIVVIVIVIVMKKGGGGKK